LIDISKLTDADKGRPVTYHSHHSMEHGRITSWNDKFIFVRYHEKIDLSSLPHRRTPRTGETSEATDPKDLELNFA
jgi:hypothetical protein